MDEEQIEIKDEFLHQHKQLQFKNNSIAASSIENKNVLNEDVHIKEEPIDLLPSIENINFMNSSICPIIKEETLGICTKSKTFNGPENLEESGIFVKSETDNKPEIIFTVNEYDSQNLMSTVSDDPLDITANHKEKFRIKMKCSFCPALFSTELELKKHFMTQHEVDKQAKDTTLTHEKTFQINQIEKEDIMEKSIDKRFHCEICDSFFKSKTILKVHIETVHEKKKPFKCNICDASFSKNGNLKIHVTSVHKIHVTLLHEGKKPFKCNICDARFITKQGMEKHIDSFHEGKKPFRCNICDASFAVKRNMKEHIDSVHEGRKSFKCNVCETSFTHQSNLNKHISSIHEGKKFDCDKCSAKFTSKSNLNRHIKAFHEEKQLFKCDICNACFTQKHGLNEHNESFHEGKKNYECNICDELFVTITGLNSHILAIHKGKKPFMEMTTIKVVTAYDTSDQELSSQNGNLPLEVDMLRDKIDSIHEEIKPKIKKRLKATPKELKCSICGEGLSSIKNLQNHFSKVHEEKQKCAICAAQFVHKKNLWRHVEAVHEKIKPFYCSICNRALASNQVLKRHFASLHKSKKMKLSDEELDTSDQELSSQDNMSTDEIDSIHDEKKPKIKKRSKEWKCLICGESLSSIKNLQSHFSTVHDGKQQCAICNAQFAQYRNLWRHVKAVHEKIKPFCCSICNRALASKQMLERHLKGHIE